MYFAASPACQSVPDATIALLACKPRPKSLSSVLCQQASQCRKRSKTCKCCSQRPAWLMQIQSLFRMRQPYRQLQRKRWAAALIQASWRAVITRRLAAASQAALVIQRYDQKQAGINTHTQTAAAHGLSLNSLQCKGVIGLHDS